MGRCEGPIQDLILNNPLPLPELFSQSPGKQLSALPCPNSNIWSTDQPAALLPPDDVQDETPPRIFGDLDILEPLVPVGQPPPFVTADHFNSFIFLSRLLKTHDKLNALDIRMMQNLDPHFRLIMSNAPKHKEYVVDKDGIFYKQLCIHLFERGKIKEKR